MTIAQNGWLRGAIWRSTGFESGTELDAAAGPKNGANRAFAGREGSAMGDVAVREPKPKPFPRITDVRSLFELSPVVRDIGDADGRRSDWAARPKSGAAPGPRRQKRRLPDLQPAIEYLG